MLARILTLASLAAAGLLAAHALAQPAALPRATADRPDDVSGAQVHVIYAVPSDGEDRGLDTNGALAGSVLSFQGWLAAQTSGSALRLDTSGGELDVTFHRLARPESEITARGAFVRDQLEADLRAAGLIAGGKLYAVYYDGGSTWSCGGGAWPPDLPGSVGAMYLKGAPPGSPPCSSNRLAAADAQPGYFEYGMLHELLHTLGFVAECAPSHTRRGHVSQPTNDLMYAGDDFWRFPAVLDAGRDDYYGHGRAGCPDLATSPYLAAFPPPATTTAPPVTTTAPPVTTQVTTTAPPAAKPGPKAKPVPKCKKGQRSTKRKPCRRR